MTTVWRTTISLDLQGNIGIKDELNTGEVREYTLPQVAPPDLSEEDKVEFYLFRGRCIARVKGDDYGAFFYNVLLRRANEVRVQVKVPYAV